MFRHIKKKEKEEAFINNLHWYNHKNIFMTMDDTTSGLFLNWLTEPLAIHQWKTQNIGFQWLLIMWLFSDPSDKEKVVTSI